MNRSVECLIVGSGPVGLLAGITLARVGRKVAVVGPQSLPPRDGRTTALLMASIEHLDRLGLWKQVVTHAAPLVDMRIIDASGSLFYTPPVTFRASELGDEAFGYNIELTDLVSHLQNAASEEANLSLVNASVSEFEHRKDGSIIAHLTNNWQVEADLMIGADGKNSKVRTFAGISAREWSYPQTAVTAIVSHDKDHTDISTEFHTREGPFTLVPLPGRRSSLVWMMKPEKADERASLTDQDFGALVETQAQFMLGRMTVESRRGLIPMAGLRVSRFGTGRVAVIGEAAHVFPPIGAQGLNLGFRDVMALERAMRSANGEAAIAKYDQMRRLDVGLRTVAVDVMNRSLLADLLPIDMARAAGLMMIAGIPPLRRFVMRRGSGR